MFGKFGILFGHLGDLDELYALGDGGGGGDTFYLLQEDGFKIQLEDASGFILLESAP